jgi:hypothetical protein
MTQALKETPPQKAAYPFDAYLDSNGIVPTAPLNNGNKLTAFLFKSAYQIPGSL